jgi:hypothetical protein
MRRHTDQALRGFTDEPHPISAIWNAFAAIWTLRNNKQESNDDTKTDETSWFTLPSGKKVKVRFDDLKNPTPYDMDYEFLRHIG